MRPARWACCRRIVGALALLAATGWALVAHAVVVAPTRADILVSDQQAPPEEDDPRWRAVTPTHVERTAVAWYRVRFDTEATGPSTMLYLPFLYGGGRISVNGVPVAEVTESSDALYVRWERPVLLPLPQGALRPRDNLLLIRAPAAHNSPTVILSRLQIGPQADLQPVFDRRLFVVRTLPVVTLVTGVVVGLLVLLIWARRRQEVLYGLFGLASIFWALRTTTFVFDALPPAAWTLWRLQYFVSTGGFIVVMALFTLALARWSQPWVTRGLVGYWALGPVFYAVGGHMFTARWWVAGFIPVGLGLALVALAAAWRRRSAATLAIAVALALGVAAGLHDYLVASSSPWLRALLPDWTAQRYFLLHHAANLLLVVMGVLLATRFVRTLDQVEAANRTLEARVQQREREIAASYERIAQMQREQAVQGERQRMVQDLHDGLGSQLFSSLMRAERGALDGEATVHTLRGAIDEMRVAIEALAPEDSDFRTAFGNFRFRWDQRLRDAGLAPTWDVDLPDQVLALPPERALQLLRVAQEALTNVLKHARASQVHVSLRLQGGELALRVADDGRGAAGANPGGRGLANMRTRAARLGGTLAVDFGAEGAVVALTLPAGAPPAAAGAATIGA
jgi:signal transduction histidine kinase